MLRVSFGRLARPTKFAKPHPIDRAAVDDGEARRDKLLPESRGRREAQRAGVVRQHVPGEPSQLLPARPGVDGGGKLPADAAAPVAAQHVHVGEGIVLHAGRYLALGKRPADNAFALRAGNHLDPAPSPTRAALSSFRSQAHFCSKNGRDVLYFRA